MQWDEFNCPAANFLPWHVQPGAQLRAQSEPAFHTGASALPSLGKGSKSVCVPLQGYSIRHALAWLHKLWKVGETWALNQPNVNFNQLSTSIPGLGGGETWRAF